MHLRPCSQKQFNYSDMPYFIVIYLQLKNILLDVFLFLFSSPPLVIQAQVRLSENIFSFCTLLSTELLLLQ